MPLRQFPYRHVERRHRAAGFVLVAVHGSHVKSVRKTAEGSRTVIVPRHAEIAVGTLRSILRQAGLSAADFEALDR